MSFVAFPFYFLLICTFSIYWLLPSLMLRRRLLLISSFAFYAAWDWRFFFLLIAAASSDFILGNLIAKRDDEK
ncbi:MAG: MBOAT family O-acyltransferase, partial [Bdellovibrionota bacterium]